MSTALALWTDKSWKRNWQLLLWLQRASGRAVVVGPWGTLDMGDLGVK